MRRCRDVSFRVLSIVRGSLPFLLVLAVVTMAGAPRAQSGADEVVVPSESCGPFFFIPIEVDGPDEGGRVTLNAIFDTGGMQLAIDPGVVKRVFGRDVRHGDAVKLRNATAGPLAFDTLKPRALSMRHLSRVLGREIDLFLPFRTFRSVLLTLDYTRDEIRAGKGRLPRPDGVRVFDARGPDRRPYLRVRIGGRERKLLVDSGASGAISIRAEGRLRWQEEPRRLRVSQGMEEIEFREIGRLAEEVEIAGVPVPAPIVTLTDGTPLIGTDLMRGFVWTFDQRMRRMRIQPSSTEPLELDSVRGTGAIWMPAEDGFEVVRVIDGTPAADAGLRPGDVVLTVDGTPVYEQGCERWDDAAKENEVELTVRRGGQSFDVSLTKIALVP